MAKNAHAHPVIFFMTVKPCRHLSSLSLGKLSDKLEQTYPLNLNSCSFSSCTTSSASFTCLTCLESFCNSGTGATHLIQHSRTRNHVLFFRSDSVNDANVVSVEDAFYCVLCGNSPRIREPGKKERTSLEKVVGLFKQNQKNQHIVSSTVKESSSFNVTTTITTTTTGEQIVSGSAPKGIINLGNTCFLNSALQLLAATLHRYGPLKLSSSSPIWISLVHHLEVIYNSNTSTKKASKKSGSDTSVNPREFLTLLCGKQKKFASMQQQDTHDFLRLLFNSIPESSSQSAPQIELFGGKFVSRVVCDRCRRVSDMTEPFLDISLSLQSSVAISLEDSLSNLSLDSNNSKDLIQLIKDWNNKIILEGENGYYCESCSPKDSESLQKASLQFSFLDLPPFLIFHLQRFKTNIRAVGGGKKKSGMIMEIEKDDRRISFPLNLIIPSECTLNSSTVYSYQLYGYIIHEGSSTSSGHYTAVVSPSNSSDRWFYVSDTRVKEISKSKALDGESYTPYLLFYQKIE